MLNLIGEYYIKVDAKGRVRLPSDLLTQLGLSSGGTHPFVVAPGKGDYLKLHTESHWNEEVKQLMLLNRHNSKQYRLMQLRFRGARKVNLDSADRLNLPKHLMERYGIKDKIVISTFVDNMEIWAEDRFEADSENTTPEEIDALEDEVLGGNTTEVIVPAVSVAEQSSEI